MPSRTAQQSSARSRWIPRLEEEEQTEVRARGRGNDGNNPITKNGTPDRRFRGQRDLPDPEIANPNYRRARSGSVVDDVHFTLDGRPDRRFKENRSMSDGEVLEAQIQALQAQRARMSR